MNWKILLFVSICFFVLVSCGSSPTTSTASQQNRVLQVIRDTGTINHYPPLNHTTTNTDAIQTLYKAALALPKASLTGRVHSCPSAYDLFYHLRFYENGTLVDSMDMNPSGCPYLLIEKKDMRSVSKSFVSLFAQTVGIPQSQVDIQPIHQPTKPPLHS